jgi:hypothetical protein
MNYKTKLARGNDVHYICTSQISTAIILASGHQFTPCDALTPRSYINEEKLGI